jgi:hypothetical protein
VVAGLDGNEDTDWKPDALLINERDPFENDAIGLQPLDPFPARGRGQADSGADFGNRKRGILLQNSKDFPVNRIHEPVFPCGPPSWFLKRKIF